jgi:hypothetical protein
VIGPGTTDDAITLAKQRWADCMMFDLDDSTWAELFSEYNPGDILQAIRGLRRNRTADPGEVFEYFESRVRKLSDQRTQYSA